MAAGPDADEDVVTAHKAEFAARGVFAVTVLLFIGGIVFAVLSRHSVGESSWGVGGAGAQYLFGFAMLSFPVAGALITWRRPLNRIGWLFLAIGFTWGLDIFLGSYYTYGIEAGGDVPGAVTALAIDAMMWVPAIGLTGVYLLMLFPTGRLPSPRWRPFSRIAGVVLGLSVVTVLFRPGGMGDSGYPNIENPLGVEALGTVIDVLSIALFLFPICVVGGVVALVTRFRRSTGIERLQLKWLAAAAGAVAATFPLAMLASVLKGTGEVPVPIVVLQSLSLYSLPLIPAAAVVAILRYRLYDLGRVVNRTLVYGSLTALLVLGYLGLVFLMQQVLAPLTTDSDLAVAGSTLAIAALARPARNRLQKFIDRRFYRRKYDAALTLERFSSSVRDEVDLGSLGLELTGVVRTTMQPAHVSLWLRPGADR